MTSKWDNLCFHDGGDCDSEFTFDVREGTIQPWSIDCKPGLPSGHEIPDQYIGFAASLTYEYAKLMRDIRGTAGWQWDLLHGKLERRETMHRMELIPLKRLLGEKVFETKGKVSYTKMTTLRTETLSHITIPLYESAGSLEHTHFVSGIGKPRTQRPPRIVIRVQKNGKFLTEMSCDASVFYIGTDTTREKALARAMRLVNECAIAPEDLPPLVTHTLRRENYGLVFREVLPKKEQLLISDYLLARRILMFRILKYSNGHAPSEDLRRMFWECPAAVVHDVLWDERAVMSCYGDGQNFELAQSSMKAMLPLLRGKYTKCVASIFRKALQYTKEDYEYHHMMRIQFLDFKFKA